ncbi:MAG: substrate-binding domain-containing protein [Hyphomicrobiales bacterium]
MDRAPHPENADRFLDFLISQAAGEIFRCYGFLPYEPGKSDILY